MQRRPQQHQETWCTPVGIGTDKVVYGLFLFLVNGHYLRVGKECTDMHHNAPCTAVQGQFPEHPFFDLRQTTLNHFNRVNDHSRADPEQTAASDLLNCLSKQ